MPYKVTNVSLEHQHALKRRTAARMQMEPIVAGKRLLLRQSVTLTDEQYAINKKDLEQFVREGIVTVESTMPFIPLKMPEEPVDKIGGVPYDYVAVDEPRDSTEDASIPPPPVTTAAPQPSTTVTNLPPSGGNYHQRRDDKKRGGR